jgi:hypothetical protein
MKFVELLQAHDQAIAAAAAKTAAVGLARGQLAEAEAQVEARVEAARKALAEAEAEAARAAEAVVEAREAVHVRLKEKGLHTVRAKDGSITVYRALPDHDFAAERPLSGDKVEA